MVTINRNSQFGYDVVITLEGRSVEAFCNESYPLLAAFVGGLSWQTPANLAHALSITWNAHTQINTTTIALGRIGQSNLDASLRQDSIVFHVSPDAPDYSWSWEEIQTYIRKLRSPEFQRKMYELAEHVAHLLS